MSVRVNVKFVGFLQTMAERESISIELDAPVCVNEVISEIAYLLPTKFKQTIIGTELNDPRPNVLVLLDGIEISALDGLETEVKNNAKLVLVPISHGG